MRPTASPSTSAPPPPASGVAADVCHPFPRLAHESRERGQGEGLPGREEVAPTLQSIDHRPGVADAAHVERLVRNQTPSTPLSRLDPLAIPPPLLRPLRSVFLLPPLQFHRRGVERLLVGLRRQPVEPPLLRLARGDDAEQPGIGRAPAPRLELRPHAVHLGGVARDRAGGAAAGDGAALDLGFLRGFEDFQERPFTRLTTRWPSST